MIFANVATRLTPAVLPRMTLAGITRALGLGGVLLIFSCPLLAEESLRKGPPAPGDIVGSLESAESPSKQANGKIDSDINPVDVIHWTIAGSGFDPATNTMTLTLFLATERGFTVYEKNLKIEPADGWKILRQVNPKTATQVDPITKKDVTVFDSGAFEIVLEVAGTPETAAINVTYVGCTKVICLFPHTDRLTIPWSPSEMGAHSTSPEIKAEPASVNTQNANSEASSSEASNSEAGKNTAVPEKGSVEELFAQQVKTGQMSFAMLLFVAFIGGILTNLTPCVAPMIPITIRLLAHQTVRPLTSAAMYALGIVATYTSLGVVAAMSGALFGSLIANPLVSIAFGITMFVLGLNMLGFGDLSRLQQIGGKIGSTKGGAFNSFLMGAGAGLVASPCTGPILAALLTYTAGRQNTLEAILLLGIYSTGFALPYVFLGASAAKLSKVRVSFHVQILTKLVFASVMFGLSLYFLRIPLYNLFTFLKPYWSMIASLGLVSGLALSALVILKESLHHNKAVFLAPTLCLGFGIFFGIQALTRNTDVASLPIHWIHSEKEALEIATKTGKPIIVDAWAEWCEACKKMDVTTFADQAVINEINANWTPLKFDLTESNDENDLIQSRYNIPGLPTLTLLPPTGDLEKKQSITGFATAGALLEAMAKFRDVPATKLGQ
jgi:thioredoxin:protein disulfide reductase